MHTTFALLSLLLAASRIESLNIQGAVDFDPWASSLIDSSNEWVAEGGDFASFFNNRKQGHGIHKWVQYFPAYHRHFKQFIGKEVHIVEIGIQSGGSMDMWKAVFGPRAHVYGVDINHKTTLYEDKQTKVYIGDQANHSFWAELKKQVPRVDILIDDGGHTVNQMLVTMSEMLPHVSSNGVYMTEDIHGEWNDFWKQMPYDMLDKHAGSVHVYPYLFVAEKATALDVMRDLGTTSAALSSGPTKLPGTKVSALPQACSAALAADKVPTASCLKAAPPQSALLYARQSNFANTEALFGSLRTLHIGDRCCELASRSQSDEQQLVDSVHVYPEFTVFKRTLSNTRYIMAPQHGSQWIPY